MANHTSPTRSWNDEERYWQDQYADRPYGSGTQFDSWRPAYRFGYESSQRYTGREWDDVESDLEREWGTYDGNDARSTWQQVKDAVRDAWNRMTTSTSDTHDRR